MKYFRNLNLDEIRRVATHFIQETGENIDLSNLNEDEIQEALIEHGNAPEDYIEKIYEQGNGFVVVAVTETPSGRMSWITGFQPEGVTDTIELS